MHSGQKNEEVGLSSSLIMLKLNDAEHQTYCQKLQEEFFFKSPSIISKLGSANYSSAKDVYERCVALKEHVNETVYQPCFQFLKKNNLPLLLENIGNNPFELDPQFLHVTLGVRNFNLVKNLVSESIYTINVEAIKVFIVCYKPTDLEFLKWLLEVLNLNHFKMLDDLNELSDAFSNRLLFTERVYLIGPHFEKVRLNLLTQQASLNGFMGKYFEDYCKYLLGREEFQLYSLFIARYGNDQRPPMLDTVFYLIQQGKIFSLNYLLKHQSLSLVSNDPFQDTVLLNATLNIEDEELGLKVAEFLVEDCGLIPTKRNVVDAEQKQKFRFTDYFLQKLKSKLTDNNNPLEISKTYRSQSI